MYIYYIGFNDKSEKGAKHLTYLGLYTMLGDEGRVNFNSGDFIVDWWNMMLYLHESNDWKTPMFTTSSQLNHLGDYGFDYTSAYLHGDGRDDKFELKYFDYSDENWFHDLDGIERDGLEFFVPDNTWTWEQLKNHCKKD